VNGHLEGELALGVENDEEPTLRREHLDERSDGQIEHALQMKGRVHRAADVDQAPEVEVRLRRRVEPSLRPV